MPAFRRPGRARRRGWRRGIDTKDCDHIRVDGPGFDATDVPDGSARPKLQFSIFMPAASTFERMRRYQAATDLAQAHGVKPRHAGLERFITTTRRQNFLVPPRRHRAFLLLEHV